MDNLQETRLPQTRAGSVAEKLFSYQTWGLGIGSIKQAAYTATKGLQTTWKGQGVPASAAELVGDLRITGARPNERQELYPRPFATTPFFGTGNGPVDRATETRLTIDGPSVRKTKDVGTISTRSTNYWEAPLIKAKKADKENEHLWIEETNGLTRLGQVTRGGNMQ